MSFPYNLRKTSREMEMGRPRIAYAPYSSSSSSSSCSSSQSSQSPSPVNSTNSCSGIREISHHQQQLAYMGNRMPASSILFSHQLDFEGHFDSDEFSDTSDESGSDLYANNHNNETVLDTNRTLIEYDRSGNELPVTRSKSKNSDAEITTSTASVTKQELSAPSTRIPVSEHKSRSNKVKATNNSISSSSHSVTMSPPPTAPGATPTTLAVSSIQTRSAGQRSTSNNQHKCPLQITSDDASCTRALTRSIVKSKLQTTSAIPLSTKSLENGNQSPIVKASVDTRTRTHPVGLEVVKSNLVRSMAVSIQKSGALLDSMRMQVNGSEKVARKKRVSPTSSAQYLVEDNDHDEDSSDDHHHQQQQWPHNQMFRIAGGNPMATRSTSSNRVSFQVGERAEAAGPGKRTGRTPPHKKFRKLRLYDTPQTPKTLLKKAQPILDCEMAAAAAASVVAAAPASSRSAKKQQTKKLLTANEVIKAVVKGSPVVTKTLPPRPRPNPSQLAPQTLKTIPKPTMTSLPKHSLPTALKQSTQNAATETTLPQKLLIDTKSPAPTSPHATPSTFLPASPPHNQQLKSTSTYTQIHEAVHHTPKSVRRAGQTPGTNLLKAPVANNPNLSPLDFTSNMDTCHNNNSNNNQSSSAFSRADITNSAHARKLFDFNSNGSDMSSIMVQSTMNKKLQFDDSDNEDAVSVPAQPKSLVFDNDEGSNNCGGSVSPVSSTSSWCSGANTQHMPPHLAKLKALSSSSNSLFKPISRFIHNQNPMGFNSSLSTALSSSSAAGLNSMRSPNSPFQFNQLHANINPFTPTNNSNATVIPNVLSGHTNLVNSNNMSMPDINAIHKESNKLHPSTTKRCLNSEIASRNLLERHASHDTETDIDMDSNSNSNSNFNSNSAEPPTEAAAAAASTAEHTQSAPRVNKRLALRQCLVSRYHEEFHEVCKLGNGEFGDVFKCINRLDGCTYAIKRSKKPIAGSALEVAAWKEVCAHAVLVKHSHIVQYYSAWAEADRMLIQNEYCNGGSLAELIETQRATHFNQNNQYNSPTPPPNEKSMSLMNEYDLKLLLLHISKGLAYMHSLNLVHLDIKPGNIFICRTPKRQHVSSGETAQVGERHGAHGNGLVLNEESGIESEGFDDDDDDACALTISNKTKQSVNMDGVASGSSFSIFSDAITYKIGDMGHVTSTLDACVEEGDCRYLPNEILQEQYDHLPKADVFALALTVFVCGTLEELPKNGDEWHWIRQGNLKDIPQCSDRFKKLLTQMVDENPVARPSASTLIHHPCIVPDASKSKSQLRKELNQEKFKNEMLKRKVKIYEQQLSGVGNGTIQENHELTQTTAFTTFSSRTVQSSKISRSISSTLL